MEHDKYWASKTNLREPFNDGDDLLRLALYTRGPKAEPRQPQSWPTFPFNSPYKSLQLTQDPTLEEHPVQHNQPQSETRQAFRGPTRQATQRQRNKRIPVIRHGKSFTIPPPFPWAGDKRATVHDLKTLAARGIEVVSGEVRCKKCQKEFTLSYNIEAEFSALRAFVVAGKESFRDRSPTEWENPALLDCNICGQKGCVKPVIAAKKRDINWLFLLLGKFIGLCSIKQLKYFCKHTKNHSTGAKNRVSYLTYHGLCKQLDETGPFEALS